MTVKNINEIEYIGESLTTINSNFAGLETRVGSVEATSSAYQGLSAYFATNSNNSDINFKNGNLSLNFGNKTYTKNDVLSHTVTVDSTKVIYPVNLYLNLINTSDLSDVSYTFKVKETSTSSFKTLINGLKVSRASSSNANDESRSLITLIDSGYYDWQIIVNGSTSKSYLHYDIRYLT